MITAIIILVILCVSYLIGRYMDNELPLLAMVLLGFLAVVFIVLLCALVYIINLLIQRLIF